MFDYKQKQKALYGHFCRSRRTKSCIMLLQTFLNSNETIKPMHKNHSAQPGFCLHIHMTYDF